MRVLRTMFLSPGTGPVDDHPVVNACNRPACHLIEQAWNKRVDGDCDAASQHEQRKTERCAKINSVGFLDTSRVLEKDAL